MNKKLTKYFKVLGQGFKTRNGFDWIKGLSGENVISEKNCVISDSACGKGIHVWKDYPRYTIFGYLPDHTFEVEVFGNCLGQDEEKARFKGIKLIRLVSKTEIFKPRADLRSADLRSVDLSSADLGSANLSSANLRSANLSWGDLSSANLSLADFRSADLHSANLRWADLRSADLSSANLRWADLSSANLRSANLSSANLSSANLRSVDLSSANLRWANLSSADLRSVDLSSADLGSAHGVKDRKEFSKKQQNEAHC